MTQIASPGIIQRDGHCLSGLDFENIMERGWNAQGDETGPGPDGAVGRHGRRTRLAARTGNDEDMTKRALVPGPVAGPNHLLGSGCVDEVIPRSLGQDRLGDADFNHPEFSDVLCSGIEDMTHFCAGEGDGKVGADR